MRTQWNRGGFLSHPNKDQSYDIKSRCLQASLISYYGLLLLFKDTRSIVTSQSRRNVRSLSTKLLHLMHFQMKEDLWSFLKTNTNFLSNH